MITIAPLVALLLGSAAASPTPAARAHDTKGFYLVASPHKSTSAKGATGLNLVDPYYQTNYLLRAQPDGASYSLFNLTSCVSRSLASWALLTLVQEGRARDN
jgi:hypothetical protein